MLCLSTSKSWKLRKIITAQNSTARKFELISRYLPRTRICRLCRLGLNSVVIKIIVDYFSQLRIKFQTRSSVLRDISLLNRLVHRRSREREIFEQWTNLREGQSIPRIVSRKCRSPLSRHSLKEEIDRWSKRNNGVRVFAARVISTLTTSNRATRTPRSLATLNARNE